MTTIVNKLVDTYHYVFTDLADPRTDDFFLVKSPWPIITLIWFYLYFCTSFGPRYMKSRQPYNLKNVVLAYNAFQICLSSYLFYEGSVYMSSEKFSFLCDPIDQSNSPRTLRLISASWLYFFTKVIEFLDTIFFVLRKKNNQISFLHVYHHSLMALCTWIGIKYFPGGHAVVMGTLNSFVHIIMYTYYLIAGLGPEYQKYIWWKKHVTVVQLVQFVIVLVHSMYPIFTDCSYPKILHVLTCINAVLFINMFGKFFYKNYIKRKPKASVTNGTLNGHSFSEKKSNVSQNGKDSVLSNGKQKVA